MAPNPTPENLKRLDEIIPELQNRLAAGEDAQRAFRDADGARKSAAGRFNLAQLAQVIREDIDEQGPTPGLKDELLNVHADQAAQKFPDNTE